ncbi:MAG: hypothetical protein H6730_04470 [Deltaproteobacteria bacterium]|nr:hypothetical protein [Deltaproteobacteria bacterium]
MSGARSYALHYESARRLLADHDAYLTHGGMLVPMGSELAPAPNDLVELRIEVPGGDTFTLPGRAGNLIPGRGLMLSFEPAAQPALGALQSYVTSAEFQARWDAEDAPGPEPRLTTIDLAEDEATDPSMPAPWAPGQAPAVADLAPPHAPDTAEEAPHAPGLALASDLLDMATEDVPATVVGDEVLAALEGGTDDLDSDDLDGLADPELDDDPDFGDDSREYGEAEVRPPRPGETYTVLVMKFTTVRAFAGLATAFAARGLFTVPVDDRDGIAAGSVAQLRLALPGFNVYEMWAQVEHVSEAGITVRVDPENESFRKAVLYPTTPPALKRIEREAQREDEPPTCLRITQERPKEDFDRLPIRRRLARMGMDDKINLALSGNREERMALAMDGNKAIHHYLLKNAKLTLDEVGFMARLPSLNPDVLDKIAESPGYTQNPTITKALVYNPKTPVKTAIRLLDRLPRSEVMNLAKRTTMNQRLVMAAKKKLERKTR